MRSLQSLIQLASLQDVLANIAAQNNCAIIIWETNLLTISLTT